MPPPTSTKPTPSLLTNLSPFTSLPSLLALSTLLRLLLLLYGLYQDAHSPLKYTDIDYQVFTSSSQYLSEGHSPYSRETYRYTPLLAYLLLPTTWHPRWFWFHFGKVLFAACDVAAGWLLFLVLTSDGSPSKNSRDTMGIGRALTPTQALKYTSIWLLNPMVATISTRGSSEGILGFLTVLILWCVMRRKWVWAGVVVGLATHFKIYPGVYGVSVLWWMDRERIGGGGLGGKKEKVEVVKGRKESYEVGLSNVGDIRARVGRFVTRERVLFVGASLFTFVGLNAVMYYIYGRPFLQHTFLYHLTRLDHRHNFSPYNTLLYLRSAIPSSSLLPLESLAFIPQLFLSFFALPFILAKKDLPGTVLAQTWAFVAFNKVCTSQYFLWYLSLLPLYLPHSSLMEPLTLKKMHLGLCALIFWLITQALWLQQGYQLEFLGLSTFVPGLWAASLSFFVANVWILVLIVGDVGFGVKS